MPTKAVIAICAACVVIGAVAFYLVAVLIAHFSKRKKKSRAKSTQKRESLISKLGVMNLILIIIGVTLFWFTREMIDLFKIYGTIPDTLVNCVFMLLGGECGIMGWIKTNKEKYRDRKWQKEDEAAARAIEQRPPTDQPPSDGSKG